MSLFDEIKLLKINLRYAWKWKLKEDFCLICQQDFYSMCSKCTHPIECAPVIGECSHIFHLHCIDAWVASNKFCPLCRKKWEVIKYFKYE
ncbi:APC11 [Hepatospora eriocheir]|uniref:APC11 n=1 Tax=Hepatospora eriocheir TaxID=1081669 RepID=A0A1X0QGT1_9MICR|nr:APC11 [Hepatospora eriocheir]